MDGNNNNERKNDDDSGRNESTETLEETKKWLIVNSPKLAVGGVGGGGSNIDWTMIKKLDLPNCGLTTLPSNLPQAVPNLSILFCPKNKFVEVPAVIGKCPKLQMISFKECHTITSIHPDALQSQLRWLILTGNLINEIPTTISRCTKLQKWMLSGNRLTQLPSSTTLSSLTNLELVRLACNQLVEPPLSLLKLPNLRWAAFASNPFLTKTSSDNERSSKSSSSLEIFDDLTLEDTTTWPVLGQGAGGVTRKVTWTRKEQTTQDSGDDNASSSTTTIDVAVKIYAGELTSDGSPQDEKAIAVQAATMFPDEPALIKIYGETKRMGGLVMEFLEDFKALAGPPSFDTCSRDVYDTSATTTASLLTPTFCWIIATSMLRVLNKLHSIGICHGDFYAHNILIRPSTHDVKLSDFGAAFRYDRTPTRTAETDDEDDPQTQTAAKDQPRTESYGQYIEKIELRSYTVLVQELYDNYIISPKIKQTTDGDDNDIGVDENDQWTLLLDTCKRDDASFASVAEQFVV